MGYNADFDVFRKEAGKPGYVAVGNGIKLPEYLTRLVNAGFVRRTRHIARNGASCYVATEKGRHLS